MIVGANRELAEANDFLATISMKIAKYISPQIYKSIFSGQRDVAIATERKKLTIFFSDIKDFTATTERLQPEDLTALLNEYFTEMSNIALKPRRDRRQVHWRRDAAVLRRSGDQGRREDARACLEWRSRCRSASASSTPNGAGAASNNRSRPAWASIPATAMSAISAARTAWTTPSSAPRRTSPRACNASPSPATS